MIGTYFLFEKILKLTQTLIKTYILEISRKIIN